MYASPYLPQIFRTNLRRLPPAISQVAACINTATHPKESTMSDTLKTTQEIQVNRDQLARYSGAVSRWCALTEGNINYSAADETPKWESELAAFSKHLSFLDERKRKATPLQF